ncbi:MAG: hypothetical protein OXL38_07800 [Gammaproteobacteria bacterium]|nr:hypothetical protein [Gammaproteobacteria bacterium]
MRRVPSQRLASANQQHELTALIDSLRQELAAWWALPETNWRLRAVSPYQPIASALAAMSRLVWMALLHDARRNSSLMS